MNRTALCLLVLGCSLLLLGVAGAQPTPVESKEKPQETKKKVPYVSGVAARVNHLIITKAEVWKRVGKRAFLKGAQKDQAYQAALLSSIRDAVEDQVIERRGVRMNDKALRKTIVQSETQRLGGEQGYRAMLTERGQSGEEYVDDVVVQIRRRQVQRILAGEAEGIGEQLRAEYVVDPTAAEIRNYYRSHQDEFTRPARIQVQVVTVTETKRRWRWMLAEAEKVRDAIRTKADPVVLAKRYSRSADAGQARWLGDPKSPVVLPEKVEAFAVKAKVGDVSDPLIFERGYHVVVIRAREEKRIEVFSEAIPLIKETLRRTKAEKAKDRLLLKHLKESYIWPGEMKPMILQILRKRR